MAIMVLSSVLSAATPADAVVLVIGGASPCQRQARLGAVDLLDLAYLVTAGDDGGLGRVEVPPHDIECTRVSTRLRLDWMAESFGWHTQSDPIGNLECFNFIRHFGARTVNFI